MSAKKKTAHYSSFNFSGTHYYKLIKFIHGVPHISVMTPYKSETDRNKIVIVKIRDINYAVFGK